MLGGETGRELRAVALWAGAVQSHCGCWPPCGPFQAQAREKPNASESPISLSLSPQQDVSSNRNARTPKLCSTHPMPMVTIRNTLF